ncbi:MAG: hypothetical protein NC324_04295, partial [Bacteroides sp.]|nr:hypothetical protein [Bacteroides sp.]
MAEGVAVGQWRTHFAPAAITQMARRHNEIFGLMNTELMCVDKIDNRLSELNLVNGLSGTGLSSVAYSALHDILLVGYSDGRLDFVYGNNDVFTIYDIADKDLNGGKAIRHIMVEGRYAYLSMPFGVVMVDLQKQEIKETYFIGTDNSYLSVFEMASDGKYLYAATEQGLKYAEISASNLNDYAAWKTDTLFAGMEKFYCIGSFGTILVSDGRRIYEGSACTGWRLFYEVDAVLGTITAMEGSADFLAISIADTVESYSVGLILNRDGKIEYNIGNFRTIRTFLWDEDGTFWIGLDVGDLVHYSIGAGKTDTYVLRGPGGNECFRLASSGRGLTMAAGGYDESFAPISRNFGAGYFYNESWYTYSHGNLVEGNINPNIRSVTRILEDPFVPNHLFFSSSINGLVEKTADGKWFAYDSSNSPLKNNRVNHLDCRVNDLAFDWDGNLWMVNAYSPEGLVGRMRDGTWKSYDLRVAGNEDERPGRIMADYWGTKWIIFNNSQLSVFKTDGNSVQGLAVDLNRGNDLKTDRVFCMVEDQLGHVWIGTNRGVKVIDQHAKMFDSPIGGISSVNAKTIKVPKDGFLIELLNTSQVRAIAVDGANRKWIGTNGDGVYLVSADGMEEIHHFTTENSPLLSDNIADISVYDKTGEVFIGNDLGIIGYRGTATVTEGKPKEEARAFPNPVRPGYQGFISVRGLPQNAIVKITDARGLLIYQGKATGGQISWDGYALN